MNIFTRLTGLTLIALFVFSLADARNEEEVISHHRHKLKHHHKKDAKHEYYMSRQIDHPDADASKIEKHGASLEDAKMQADGLLEDKKKGKKFGDIPMADMKLQDIAGEEGRQRRHHRHEVKVKEEAKSEGHVEEEIMKDEGTKMKKLSKKKDVVEKSESTKVEEVKQTETKLGGDVKSEKNERKNKSHHEGGKKKGRKGHGQNHKGKKHGKKAKTSRSQKKEKKQRKN